MENTQMKQNNVLNNTLANTRKKSCTVNNLVKNVLANAAN